MGRHEGADNNMSVPVGKRGESKLDFFYNAYHLTDDITRFLIKDFGVKNISRDLKAFTRKAKMDNEDKETFSALCLKYNIDVEADYPIWLIDYYRTWILDICRRLIDEITMANTIYPNVQSSNFEHFFKLKQEHQYNAIAACYQLKQALQAAGRILPVNFEKFMPFVDRIDTEINSLKTWRKSGNKLVAKYKGAVL